ncbi:hypothetical protein D1BOALGB6SA_9617 [Olavius sp. associated proteobacterium Delta 1]|nr:hypothetical protein D1BOALGB6SA_9617 [Olavius sp. associated proteobacterium Delta 1]
MSMTIFSRSFKGSLLAVPRHSSVHKIGTCILIDTQLIFCHTALGFVTKARVESRPGGIHGFQLKCRNWFFRL